MIILYKAPMASNTKCCRHAIHFVPVRSNKNYRMNGIATILNIPSPRNHTI